jgi:hypothetical protein
MTVALTEQNNLPQCVYCGQAAPIIWVHGHGQCAHCKINVDECCRGENACVGLR